MQFNLLHCCSGRPSGLLIKIRIAKGPNTGLRRRSDQKILKSLRPSEFTPATFIGFTMIDTIIR
jgi:hypothetical protein